MTANAVEMDVCTLTRHQLYDLLMEALKRFQYYQDQYDYDEEQARRRAVLATLNELGLDSALYGFVWDEAL
jgi:hypothetical protein